MADAFKIGIYTSDFTAFYPSFEALTTAFRPLSLEQRTSPPS
jgi:hypothetical protein